MPILNLNDKTEVKKYNAFLKKNNALINQDLRWGQLKSNWITEAVYIKDTGKIVGAMTILIRKVPLLNTHLMYASRGPVLEKYDIELFNKLVEAAKPLQEKYKAFALILDPEIKYSEQEKQTFIASGYKIQEDDDILIQPRHNMVLYLENKDSEELIKTFSEKTRYNIRLAARKGVTVRYSNREEDLKEFYKLYKITALRDKIGIRPFDYFQRMLKSFNQSEVRIYLAEYENEVLASAITLNYGKKMFYVYGASSNNKRNLMPNYIMQWEMIKYALESNCEQYDFGGVFHFTHEDGLYKFKSGFCKKDGVSKYIGEITKVYNPLIYFMYTDVIPKTHKIKKKIRKIIRSKC